MNLLFHLLSVDPEHDAVAKRTLGMAEILVKHGHNVFVVSNMPDYINSKKRRNWLFSFRKHETINGVHYQRYFTIPFFYKGTIRRLMNYYSFSFSSRFARIKNNKIDVVIATEPPLICCKSAAYLAKKFRAKLIMDIQDIWPDVGIEIGALRENDFKSRSLNKIANYMYKRSDAIITVSNYKVINLNKKLERFNKKAILIPNATDSFFANQEADYNFLNEYKFNKYFSCVHVGKIGKAQDLDLFLELAKQNSLKSNIRFYLLGDGVMLHHILERIKNENITNVTYCGVCNSQQCFTALKFSKLSYVSLINKNLKDSVPTKLFESLYVGCPCLVCANGESAEIIDYVKFGLSGEAGNVQQMMENFDYIYNHYDSILKYKEQCINYVQENYERLNVTIKLERFIETLFID